MSRTQEDSVKAEPEQDIFWEFVEKYKGHDEFVKKVGRIMGSHPATGKVLVSEMDTHMEAIKDMGFKEKGKVLKYQELVEDIYDMSKGNEIVSEAFAKSFGKVTEKIVKYACWRPSSGDCWKDYREFSREVKDCAEDAKKEYINKYWGPKTEEETLKNYEERGNAGAFMVENAPELFGYLKERSMFDPRYIYMWRAISKSVREIRDGQTRRAFMKGIEGLMEILGEGNLWESTFKGFNHVVEKVAAIDKAYSPAAQTFLENVNDLLKYTKGEVSVYKCCDDYDTRTKAERFARIYGLQIFDMVADRILENAIQPGEIPHAKAREIAKNVGRDLTEVKGDFGKYFELLENRYS